MELTILMPCLNERESIGFCVDEALAVLKTNALDGEVLVADNGSEDGSREIAAAHGARVVTVSQRGYGSALRHGVTRARGDYVIMADSDGSYDLSHVPRLLEPLRTGADVVIGNRYGGRIEPGAFPWTHRYIGVPVLSALGRIAGHCQVRDFHCGLRGVNRKRFLSLGCVCTGMEFASEMILLAGKKQQQIVQVPTDLRQDYRQTAQPHLRAIPDGLRHLRVIIKYLF